MNIMVGPSLHGRGGISSVVAVLDAEGFIERHNIVYLCSHRDGSGAAKAVTALQSLCRFVWMCVHDSPNIVHVHCASHASFYRKSAFLAMARLFGKKTIFHCHGAVFRDFATVEAGPLTRWWIRTTLRRSSKVIALSMTWHNFFLEFAPGCNVEIVPNLVPVSTFPVRETEQEGRILFLGRVDDSKGIYHLVQAVALVREKIPHVRLVIGGLGDLNEVRMQANALGIASHIEIRGWVDQECKAKELACAAVFCLPSIDEGLPMAMLEAMAASKAIVVTSVGGIPDAVKDHENGLLIPPGDVCALADALSSILSNAQLRARLGAQARKSIESRYSTAVVLNQLTKLYDELERSPV